MKGEISQIQKHKLIYNIILQFLINKNMFCRVNGFYKCSPKKSKCHIKEYIYYYRVHTCLLAPYQNASFHIFTHSQTQKKQIVANINA
jgi:hypothetical protein